MERIGGNQKEYEEYEYNKLNLVTGKVQSGKTAVCIQSIIQDQNENNIDLLFTMNSMSASSQFISRVKSSNIEPESIIVFNSDKRTSCGCYHAKDINGVIGLITLKIYLTQ